MSNLQTKITTDTWIPATWEEYVQIIADPVYAKAKSYYHNRQLRVEMPPLGHDHAADNTIITLAVSLFCIAKNIPIKGLTNCTYRKTGVNECQPDVSYYVRDKAQIVPWGTSIIDLDLYPPPDLVIEVANTSLADDKGEKRLLYEDIQVGEYWIVDVQNVQITAFAIENGGSKRINQSSVLPGLDIAVLQAALRSSREKDQTQVAAWLLTQFQQ